MAHVCRFFSNFATIICVSGMEKITIQDKTFEIMMTEEQILSEIDKVAQRINEDLKDKNPLFMPVLNGSFMFASDLMKRVNIPCELSFVKMASYQGTTSTGKIKELMGVNEDLTGRTVVIVEDIVESGFTLKTMIESLGKHNPAAVHICSLFVKPNCLKVPLDIDYGVITIADDFIVGYGLDYNQQGRNYKDLYVLSEEESEE